MHGIRCGDKLFLGHANRIQRFGLQYEKLVRAMGKSGE